MLDERTTRGVIRVGLQEDMAHGPDVTSLATIGPTARLRARVVSREHGVAAATQVIGWTLAEVIADGHEVDLRVADGDRLAPGTVLAEIDAPARGLLTAERTMLNLLTHACGIATGTRAWVDAVAGTGTRIRDTRKTLPGLRNLEKHAVACGGGVNHRLGLGDEALVKDNHVAAAGGAAVALERVRRAWPELRCEIEVDDLAQLEEVLAAKPELVLLDNFEVWQTQVAVQRRAKLSPATQMESSGGLRLENARDYAGCGVDFLAVGALTHSARALDLGLDVVG